MKNINKQITKYIYLSKKVSSSDIYNLYKEFGLTKYYNILYKHRKEN